MTKIKLLAFAILIPALSAWAQKAPTRLVSAHFGYGSENNYGFVGLLGGASYEKLHGPKLSTGLSASYFYSGGDDRFTNGSERYQALFFSARGGYHIFGNSTSLFRCNLSAGPAIRYAAARYFKGIDGNAIYVRDNPDGTQSIREPFSYHREKTLTLMVQGGLDFTFRITKNAELSLMLDTYSREIALEHTYPAIKVSSRL